MENDTYNPDWSASNQIGTENHADTLHGTTSTDSLTTSLSSTGSTSSTAATSMTSLGTSSLAHSSASDITAAIPLEQSKRRSTKVKDCLTKPDPPLPEVPCVGCWESKVQLVKHYPVCPYLKGEWTFWPCPYIRNHVFTALEPFIHHLLSFRLDKIRIESTLDEYVTPRTWLTHSREDAMKRQLTNILYGYFRLNPEFLLEWQSYNDGETFPNLDNVASIEKVLELCSKLLRRAQSGNEKPSPIAQLKELFPIVTEISTQPWGMQPCTLSVSYNALPHVPMDSNIQGIVGVEIEEPNFNAAELQEHQQRQLGSQDQDRYLFQGGVGHIDSRWPTLGPSDARPAGGTSNAPVSLGYQSQRTNGVSDNSSSGVVGVHYGQQIYFAGDTDFQPSPQLLPTLQRDAHADPSDAFSASDNSFFTDLLSPPTTEQVNNGQEGAVANTSARNVVGGFDSPNSGFLPQYLANAPFIFDFDTGYYFPHANPFAPGYERQ